jgi:NAD(P)-dependent dehydrogenase (short-subunit alcohol dehydrogenase family)
MKVIVVGATGTVGTALAGALETGHEVVRVSRRGDLSADLADLESLPELFARVPDADAVACCAASAPLTSLADDGFLAGLRAKLLGQVELARQAAGCLRDGGAIVLTSGKIPENTPGSAGGALVNAGLEAFVRAAATEMPRGVRLNAVSPGWVRETLVELGMDGAAGTPASTVARAYVNLLEGTARGQVVEVT